MAKTYSSVSDLVKANSGDKAFNRSFDKLINDKRISKTLFILRCKAGLTQKELADKINVSQAKISKLEDSFDNNLNIGDVVNYCSALNVQLNIGFSDVGMNLVDMVKFHWFKLRKYLDKIRDLSKGDKKMEQAAWQFTSEAVVNVSQGLMDCLTKATPTQIVKESLHVSKPVRVAELGLHTGQTLKK